MKRYSVKNRQNQKGPEITLDESKNERLLVYHAYFKRLLMDEGGDNTNCVNYPNKQFKTFADCDQDFIRRQLPPDFKPFWNQEPNDLEGVTTRYYPKEAGQDEKLFQLTLSKTLELLMMMN